MYSRIQKPSAAWVSFSCASVVLSAGLLGYGLLSMPIDQWQRFFLLMGIAMFAQAIVVATKTLRDNEEAEKLMREPDDAGAVRLPREPQGSV
ncbi:YiaA/YiaB family inner membrane protein [Aurantimonas sp. MSK8Z-1]|uniref:YiaA/YiaB family inner membrane protein n=1 Tax=Mangrovibrevibacter kandeliae TaxID=2968473 RepID=UPI00211794D5|nr:YiaA/YiaB family inner membrane protein [Aurantimonas sp. MSK8Z-1]MCW4116312.1 YiaA/YiaB family inner membrane protein [Aurantimonas sp. MSK8Z-1]